MLLIRTLAQLDIGPVSMAQAKELGNLGYLQWLGSLPGSAGYIDEAKNALTIARPLAEYSPAVQVFCELLDASIDAPLAPLAVRMPPKQRRGGAKSRRAATRRA